MISWQEREARARESFAMQKEERGRQLAQKTEEAALNLEAEKSKTGEVLQKLGARAGLEGINTTYWEGRGIIVPFEYPIYVKSDYPVKRGLKLTSDVLLIEAGIRYGVTLGLEIRQTEVAVVVDPSKDFRVNVTQSGLYGFIGLLEVDDVVETIKKQGLHDGLWEAFPPDTYLSGPSFDPVYPDQVDAMETLDKMLLISSEYRQGGNSLPIQITGRTLRFIDILPAALWTEGQLDNDALQHWSIWMGASPPQKQNKPRLPFGFGKR